MILWELFYSFCLVGIFCVGGGYASVPLIQHQVIDLHAWMTLEEFLDVFAISQMTPGPIGINAATFVGSKVAGIPGSVAATLGFVAPSLVIMLLLAYLLEKYGTLGGIRGILNGLSAAVVALVASAGLMFLTLAVWNVQKLQDLVGKQPPTDWCALAIVIISLVVYKKKWLGVIQTIVFGGVLNLLLRTLI